jgi:hypothetical protein
MHAALVLLVSFAVTIGVTAWILHFDIARLSPERLARAWPTASLWSAIVYFSPLCLLIHFAKTRRSLLGLLLGIGWLVVDVAVIEVLARGADWLIATLVG